MGDGDSKCVRQWRPAHRDNRICRGVSHQRNRFTEQKDLDLVPRFRESIGMQERKRRFGRVIGTPSTLDQHLHGHLRVSLTMPDVICIVIYPAALQITFERRPAARGYLLFSFVSFVSFVVKALLFR
jgi:hypothetical protein